MKGRGCKAKGGEAMKGVESKDPKPARYNNSKVESEAEERSARKRGGHVHHEHGKHLGHAKHLGHIEGSMHVHSGRKVRRSGGRAGSNFSPLSSAHKGSNPKEHTMGGDCED